MVMIRPLCDSLILQRHTITTLLIYCYYYFSIFHVNGNVNLYIRSKFSLHNYFLYMIIRKLISFSYILVLQIFR